MANLNTATSATEQKAPEAAPEQKPPASSPVGDFFKTEDDDDKAAKWRFVAKGSSLASILAVFGATPHEGDKQVSYKVDCGSAGLVELGDVVRHLFTKAHAAGVTLPDLVALVQVKAKERGVK
jgi:hypothetical protein